jgi:hypothetical protein
MDYDIKDNTYYLSPFSRPGVSAKGGSACGRKFAPQ